MPRKVKCCSEALCIVSLEILWGSTKQKDCPNVVICVKHAPHRITIQENLLRKKFN